MEAPPRFDGYTDLRPIGRGGLGDVHRATRTDTGGTVAIKLLRDVTDGSTAWHRTRRELAALASLAGHPHVIQVVEVLPGTPGLVMEFAPGGSVARLLERRGGPLEVGEVVLVGRQAAAALAAAHDRGIVHRDVKPPNLLIDAAGQVKLCDFGIASLARTEEFRSRTDSLSMRYASPEDLEDDGEVGPPTDVYSLGATLLHLSHGAPPTLWERLGPWVPPPTTDAELAALDRIVADCLQPEPGRRPSARDVRQRLESLDWGLVDRHRALPVEADDTSGGATEVDAAVSDVADDETVHRTGRRRPLPERPGPRPTPGANRTGRVAAVALAVVAGGAVAWSVSRSPDPDDPAPPTTGVTIVARPADLPSLDQLRWPFGPVGECLVQQPGAAELAVVDCAEPHDLQRFAVGLLDDLTTDSPATADGIDRAVAERCRAEAPEPVPVPAGRIATTGPTPASWERGDRGYQCLIGIPDSRISGDALP